ncbi:HET-domain-containing protein [Ganoderma leucocontextum]|nr:HET-domain-containing protein [Ganoderma leucocontextum]
MHLLDTWTGRFVEKDPRNPETKYAILSHTWDPEGEQTYQELGGIQKRYAPGAKRQPPNNPRGAQSDSLSSADRHQDIAFLTSSLFLIILFLSSHDLLPTTPTAAHNVWSSAPSVSQPSHTQSSTTPVVPSPPDTPPGHSKPPLRPIWDDPELSPKIRRACTVARANGYRYIWIDSCCIDKTSSSELSEAINSMYQWYSRAVMCFAFLADVPAEEDHGAKDSEFRQSRWFTRGWTLQELIAPLQVVFLSMTWTSIGSKSSLASLLTEITGISYTALLRVEPLKEFSVAQRLSWAAKRETTRLEDRAYSLLGIFDINMPTLYGEGHHAFRRLQEEIMRRIPDQTLFAWTLFSLDSPTEHHGLELDSATFQKILYSQDMPDIYHPSLLAPSPDLFRECGRIEPVSRDEAIRRLQQCHLDLPAADYYSTPYGIRTHFAMIPFSAYFPAGCVADLQRHHLHFIPLSQWYLAVLECEHKDYPGHLLGRVCYTHLSSDAVELPYCGFVEVSFPTTPFDPSRPFEIILPTTLFNPDRRFDLLPLSPTSLKCLPSPYIEVNTVYIPHADSEEHDGAFEVTRWTPHDTIKMVLLKKTRDELHVKGYTIELRGPDHVHPTTHLLTLSHATHNIAFEFQHTLTGRSDDQKLTVHNRVSVSGHPRGNSVRHSSLPWAKSLGFGISHIAADLPGCGGFLISNELTLATKDHYAIHVELLPKSFIQDLEPMAREKMVFQIGKQVIRGGEGIGGIPRGLEARDAWRRRYGPGGELAAIEGGRWWYGGEREVGDASAASGEPPGGADGALP